MNLEFPSTVDYGMERAAEILARAFEGYFVRIPFTIGTLLHAARADSVDLTSIGFFEYPTMSVNKTCAISS